MAFYSRMKDFIKTYISYYDYILKLNTIINSNMEMSETDRFLRISSNKHLEELIHIVKEELKYLELTLEKNMEKMKKYDK